MRNKENEARRQAMADAYLEEKNPQRYYLLHREDDCCSASDMVALSDADLAEIQQLQKHSSDLPLYEVVEGTKFSDVIAPDEEGLLPVELGTEPYYGCDIEIVDADVTREKQTHKTQIYLHLDSYRKLLAWKMDNRTSAFCHMAIEKPELAAQILDQLGPADYMYSCFPKGFAIRLTEIDQDVYNMLGDEATSKELKGQEGQLYGCIFINEKKVEISVQRLDGIDISHCETLQDIQVDDVFPLFNAHNSKELAEAIVSRYDCTNVIPAIRALLEEQDISFRYVYWN